MKERTASQLQWHLQQYVQDLVKNQNLTDPDLIRQVQQFEIPLEPHDLIETVKAGATINGDYVLTYAKDVADHIKKKPRDYYTSSMRKSNRAKWSKMK